MGWFRVGDVVRCKRGFLGNGETEQLGINPIYGGSAYQEGLVLTIKRIYTDDDRTRGRNVAFFEEYDNGVFLDALEHVDKVEPAKFLSKFKFV